MEICTAAHLTFRYPNTAAEQLSDTSFSLEEGAFLAVCGETGSGKSTLLRLLKPEITPNGTCGGTLLYRGASLSALPARISAGEIGYVGQRPEEQIVTERVWQEIAFGLENRGLSTAEIRVRSAETASYFGLEAVYDAPVATLSGGQKQLLTLASVMVLEPSLLLLDEPSAQLDPIMAARFLETVARLHRDLGVTVILAEHRLEEVLPVATHALVLRRGKQSVFGKVREIAAQAADLADMPAAVRIYGKVREARGTSREACPLTVPEGRRFLEARLPKNGARLPDTPAPPDAHRSAETVLDCREVYFRYEKEGADILRGLTMQVHVGEIVAILGGNGSGKSTALSVLAGLLRPYAGHLSLCGKDLRRFSGNSLYQNGIARLPQDVQTVFLENTVRRELSAAGVDTASLPFDLTGCMDTHPYDLSGGEQQLVALAKALATHPRLLLLDEATRGLDGTWKERLRVILQRLAKAGMAIVCVTHDVSFAAETATRAALFFRGEIVAAEAVRPFFTANRYYTTPVRRMTRGLCPDAIMLEDAVRLCLAEREGERTCL